MTPSISFGSREKYGKEIASDLYEGKRTSMLNRLFGTDVLFVVTLLQL